MEIPVRLKEYVDLVRFPLSRLTRDDLETPEVSEFLSEYAVRRINRIWEDPRDCTIIAFWSLWGQQCLTGLVVRRPSRDTSDRVQVLHLSSGEYTNIPALDMSVNIIRMLATARNEEVEAVLDEGDRKRRLGSKAYEEG